MSRGDIEQAVSLTKKEWNTDPELKKNRDEVLEKFGKIFKLENIDDLTAEEFRGFLRYSENHHWDNIQRNMESVVSDMNKLKKGLKRLLDESIPISERIKNIREEGSEYNTKGWGVATYTPVLFVAYPKKYPVINGTVAKALDQLGLYDIKKWKNEDEWISIPEMQEIIRSMAKKHDLDFWQIDWVWWKIAKEGGPIENSNDSLLEYLKKTPMNANFKPIVIKTLLEKGPEENFTASLDEIKENLTLLNFGRTDFEINQAIKSVSDALKELVVFGKNVSPLDLEIFTTADATKCLKICGQKIAQWHMKHIVNDDSQLWRVKPGMQEEGWKYLNEFLKTTSIGVGWNYLGDLSEFETESDVYAHIDKVKPGFQSKSSVTAISHKMAEKDLVVVTKAQQEIVDFGIITSKYQFEDKGEDSYAHRRHVVWLKQGPILKRDFPEQHLGGSMQAAHEVHGTAKKRMIDFLLGEKNETGNYFIITSYPDSKYDDKEGEQYHFPSHIPHAKEFVEGTNFIVQTKKDKKNYFVGYGKVGKIEKFEDTNTNGKQITMHMAKFSEYTEFDEPKARTEEINKKMLWIAFPNTGRGNQPPAMLDISKELDLYREIMGEDLEDNILDNKMDKTTSEILDLLEWKKNVILYGPPGTGKTWTCEQIQKEYEEKSKIALLLPSKPTGSETDKQKLERQQNDISDDGHILWGLWQVTKEKIEAMSFPIVGYLCAHGKITATANIVEIIPSDQVNSDEEVDTEKYNNFAKIDKITKCDPSFPDAKLRMWKDNSIVDSKFNTNFSYVKELDTQKVKFVTFHPSYSYEDFIEGIRPVIQKSNLNDEIETNDEKETNDETNVHDKIGYELQNGIFKTICDDATKDPERNHLLIIDEVNRGNISKIFGELITLIEDNKRNKLSVNLAYSKDSFTVPKNLHILGTMNTADKSLIEMDTALRRRFAFKELMPNHKLVDTEVDGVHLGRLLNALNEKIRKKDQRDKQIGHSYFMNKRLESDEGPEELQRVFKYEIIPLLQDYFYQDYEILQDILGGRIVSKTNMIVNEKFIDNWNAGKVGFKKELITIIEKKQQTEEEIEQEVEREEEKSEEESKPKSSTD